MAINAKSLSVIITTLTCVWPALSSAGEHEHPTQEAHVHGLAELTLVLEGNTLEISIESPAANIVGFEHRAATPEQNRSVEQAKKVLESEPLFVLSGARCGLKKAAVDVSAVTGDDDHDHKHDNDHAQDNDHKSAAHQNHDHSEDHHGGHSEITANYSFQCDQGKNLTSISVEIFDQFPGIEKMNAMWVTDTRQGATQLSAATKAIRLR